MAQFLFQSSLPWNSALREGIVYQVYVEHQRGEMGSTWVASLLMNSGFNKGGSIARAGSQGLGNPLTREPSAWAFIDNSSDNSASRWCDFRECKICRDKTNIYENSLIQSLNRLAVKINLWYTTCWLPFFLLIVQALSVLLCSISKPCCICANYCVIYQSIFLTCIILQ